MMVLQVVINRFSEGGATALWAVSSATGMAVLAAVVAAARWLGRRHATSLTAVFTTYVVGSFAQVLVLAVTARALGLLSGLQLEYRLLVPLFVLVPLLTLVGFAVATHAAHRRVIADLEQERARLLAYGPSLELQLDRLEAELTGAVRASVEPALVSLDAALATAARDGDNAPALAALDAVMRDDVRPLSHHLAAAAGSPPPQRDAGAAHTPARVPLPRRFAAADGMRPVGAAVALVVGAFPSTSRNLPPGRLLVSLAILGVAFGVVLWMARRAVGGWTAPTPVGATVAVAVNMAAGAVAFAAMRLVGVDVPLGLAIAAVIWAGAIGALIVVATLVSARRSETEVALAAATEHLAHVIALMQRRQRMVRRRLAFVLHGSLQGALYAAALRVQEAARVDGQLIDEVRAGISAAMAQLGAPLARRGGCRTREALDDAVEMWEGRRRVTASLAPDAEAALRAESDADDAVAEVVREAINNAFRHGGATAVSVHVALAEPTGGAAATIVVRDDGTGRGAGSTPGLGTALFDDVCGSWSRSGDAGGSTFRAKVGLAAM